jgi:hypothetical protein
MEVMCSSQKCTHKVWCGVDSVKSCINWRTLASPLLGVIGIDKCAAISSGSVVGRYEDADYICGRGLQGKDYSLKCFD